MRNFIAALIVAAMPLAIPAVSEADAHSTLLNSIAAYEHVSTSAVWVNPQNGSMGGGVCSKHWYSSTGVRTVSYNAEWSFGGWWYNGGRSWGITFARLTGQSCDPSAYGGIWRLF